MTGWTAIVPIKPVGMRKSRLAGHYSGPWRARLSDALFAGVVEALQASPEITRILVVAARPLATAGVEWVPDCGGGLNPALEAARRVAGAAAQLILHADLPLVVPADIAALVAAAGNGVAIAPDGHGTGTNALAIASGAQIVLRFGANSFALHHDQCLDAAIVVGRPGLAIDIDAPADCAEAARHGWVIPADVG